jgi:hypothetical protein
MGLHRISNSLPRLQNEHHTKDDNKQHYKQRVSLRQVHFSQTSSSLHALHSFRFATKEGGNGNNDRGDKNHNEPRIRLLCNDCYKEFRVYFEGGRINSVNKS